MAVQPALDTPVRLIDRWIEAFNAYDVVAFGECYGVDAVLEDTALQRVFTGRDEVAGFMRNWLAACPDTGIELDEVVVGTGTAAVAWTGTGTLLGDFTHLPPGAVRGSRLTQRGVSIMRFGPDGLISSQTDYYDVLGVLRQIGLVPA